VKSGFELGIICSDTMRKPKSNDNGKYKRVIEREEENGG
jgi:hypothetical protein